MRNSCVVLLFSLAVVGLPAAANPEVVYTADFEDGLIPGEFSGGGVIADTAEMSEVGFGAYCLHGDDNPTTLTLTGLPAHNSLSLDFIVAMIGSWDGLEYDAGGNPNSIPDYWSVTVDGESIFTETFDNHPAEEFDQTFVPPEGSVLARFALLPGWGESYSAYDMSYVDAFQDIPHTADSVTIEWFAHGDGYEGIGNESWAIDNLSITAVPEPASLLLIGLGALALRRR